MKDVIKKYYKLDDETKEMLEALYMLNELECSIEDYENVEIDTLGDEEILLAIAMNCTYLTDLGPDEIIKRLLEILNCRDITVNDLNELDSDELIELMENVDDEIYEKENNSKIIAEFFYKGLFCVLFKDNEKYIITYEKKDDDVRVLIFNNIIELLSIIIQRDLVLSKAES